MATTRATPGEIRAREAALREGRWCVFVLPEGIDSKASFFDAVRLTLPLDPPFGPSDRHKWDALDDSLSAGLLDVEAAAIAILWPDAYIMEAADPDSFRIAMTVFDDLPEVLQHGEWTNDGIPKKVLILLGEKTSADDNV